MSAPFPHFFSLGVYIARECERNEGDIGIECDVPCYFLSSYVILLLFEYFFEILISDFVADIAEKRREKISGSTVANLARIPW